MKSVCEKDGWGGQFICDLQLFYCTTVVLECVVEFLLWCVVVCCAGWLMMVGLGGCIYYVTLTVERFFICVGTFWTVVWELMRVMIEGGHPSGQLLRVLLNLTDYHISFLNLFSVCCFVTARQHMFELVAWRDGYLVECLHELEKILDLWNRTLFKKCLYVCMSLNHGDGWVGGWWGEWLLVGDLNWMPAGAGNYSVQCTS